MDSDDDEEDSDDDDDDEYVFFFLKYIMISQFLNITSEIFLALFGVMKMTTATRM